MGSIIKVGMADLAVGTKEDILITMGLGSCVGVVLYDRILKIGGMAHFMLPDSKQIKNNSNRAKFADTAIEDLIKTMVACGGKKSRFTAKIAGGAKMFECLNKNLPLGNIGEFNAIAAKKILAENRIPILIEDVGQNYGRTIEFNCENGELKIRSVGKKEKIV